LEVVSLDALLLRYSIRLVGQLLLLEVDH